MLAKNYHDLLTNVCFPLPVLVEVLVSELLVLMYVVVTWQLLSPVSMRYGCRLNASVDSMVELYPSTSLWVMS